jgi:hypothetical protein
MLPAIPPKRANRDSLLLGTLRPFDENLSAGIDYYTAAFRRRKSPLQRSEQVFTLSQSRAHFLRHAKGRAQAAQIFSGNVDLV